MGEAGADCVQQVAFTLAGIEYIEAAISAGLKIDNSLLACRSSSASAWICL
ncbi:methylmalonyl-CoA mutase family protein [Shigella flexneri]